MHFFHCFLLTHVERMQQFSWRTAVPFPNSFQNLCIWYFVFPAVLDISLATLVGKTPRKTTAAGANKGSLSQQCLLQDLTDIDGQLLVKWHYSFWLFLKTTSIIAASGCNVNIGDVRSRNIHIRTIWIFIRIRIFELEPLFGRIQIKYSVQL